MHSPATGGLTFYELSYSGRGEGGRLGQVGERKSRGEGFKKVTEP